jgi:general secretion pathway protein D
VFGGTSFNSGGNNILNLAARPGHSSSTTLPGNGLNLLLGGGTITSAARDRQPQHAGPLPRVGHQGQHPVHAQPVTLDNEEAKIVVGRNVPFVTGTYATTGTTTTANPFTTVERKDVA